MDDLELRIMMLEKKVNLLEARIKILEGKSNPTTIPSHVSKSILSNLSRNSSEAFVDEFNALNDLSGFDARNARRQFVEKFHVQAFSCSNYEYRMTHPDTPPEFQDESSGKGTFWAIPSKENFSVVPNLKTYEEQYHLTGGMQEAFESNFTGGRTYGKIQLIRPAVFAKDLNGWRIIRRGELKLR